MSMRKTKSQPIASWLLLSVWDGGGKAPSN